MSEQVRASLRRAYRDIKGVPPELADDARLDEAGFDSLDLLEAATLVEKELGIRLDPDDFIEVSTFGDLVSVVERATRSRPPARG